MGRPAEQALPLSNGLDLRAVEVTSSSVFVGGAGTVSRSNAGRCDWSPHGNTWRRSTGTAPNVLSTLPEPSNPHQSHVRSGGVLVARTWTGAGQSVRRRRVHLDPEDGAMQVALAGGTGLGFRPNPTWGANGPGVVYDIEPTALNRSDGARRWSVLLGGSFAFLKTFWPIQDLAEATIIGSSSGTDGFPTDFDPKMDHKLPGSQAPTGIRDVATSGGVLAVGGDFSKVGYAERGDLSLSSAIRRRRRSGRQRRQTFHPATSHSGSAATSLTAASSVRSARTRLTRPATVPRRTPGSS